MQSLEHKNFGTTQMLIAVSGATTSIYYARIIMSSGIISSQDVVYDGGNGLSILGIYIIDSNTLRGLFYGIYNSVAQSVILSTISFTAMTISY